VAHLERVKTTGVKYLLAVLVFSCIAGLTGTEEAIADSSVNAQTSVRESVTVDPELLSQLENIAHFRIVLHAPEPLRQLVAQVSTLLTALGAKRVEQRFVAQSPDEIEIRFFHTSDHEAAKLVKDALLLVFDTIDLRDFTNYKPSPDQKLIEVWL